MDISNEKSDIGDEQDYGEIYLEVKNESKYLTEQNESYKEEGYQYQYDAEFEELLFESNQIKLEKSNDCDLEIHELLSDSEYATEAEEDDDDDDDEEEQEKEHEEYKPNVRTHQKMITKSTSKDMRINRPKYSCIYCGQTIRSLQYQAIHYADEHKELDDDKIVFVCPSCGDEFPTEEMWQHHCNEVHELNELSGLSMESIKNDDGTASFYKVKCLKCPATLRKRLVILLIHASLHLPHKMYKCKHCAEQFRRKWMIRTHFCAQLEEILKLKLPPIDYEELAKVQREHELSNLLHVCPVCGEEFDLKKTWTDHLASEHEIDNINKLNLSLVPEKDGEKPHYKCGVCDKTWNKQHQYIINAMKFHVLSHLPFKIKKCKICKHSSTMLLSCFCQRKPKYKLNLAHIDDCTLLCTKCGTPSENFADLNNHYYTDHNIRTPEDLNFKFIGRIDGKRFMTYECTACEPLAFRAQSYTTMFMHGIKHDNTDWLKCKYCEVKYRCVFTLKNHAFTCQTGTGTLRIFSHYKQQVQGLCPACGKTFTAFSKFRKHITQEHDFSNIANLNIVEVKNIDEKHYKCTVCDRLFTTYLLRELQSHAFVHMPFKLFNCRICNGGFDTQVEIVNHLKYTHQIEKSKKRNRESILDNEHVLFRCPMCNIWPKNFSALMQHLDNEHNFNTPEGLALKLRKCNVTTNEYGQVYECLDCDQTIRYDSKPMQRIVHRLSHLPNKPFLCSFCKKAYYKSQNVLLHVKKCKGGRKKRTSNSIQQKVRTRTKRIKSNARKKKVAAAQKKALDTIDDDPLNVQTTTLAEISTVRICTSNDGAVMKEFDEYITYACPECNMPLETQVDFQTHITLNHSFFDDDQMHIDRLPDGKYQCTDCGVTVDAAVTQRQRHKLTHLPYGSYICSLCGHRSNTAFVLIGHIRRRHFAIGEFKCPICALVLETSYKCVLHCQTEHTEAEYPKHFCRLCTTIYASPSSLQRHNEMHDINRTLYKCLKCEHRVYKDRGEFNKHLKAVHPEQVEITLVNCLICQRSFKKRSELQEHIRIQHDEAEAAALDLDLLACKLCHQIFGRRAALTRHTDNVHADKIETFPCSICARSYAKFSSLKYHYEKDHPDINLEEKKNEAKKPINCLICNAMSKDRSELEQHIKEHHNEGQDDVKIDRLACKICHQSFSRLHNLTTHTMAKHTGEPRPKPYPCDICGQRYTVKANLNYHWRKVHAGLAITMTKKQQEDHIKKGAKAAAKVKTSAKQQRLEKYVPESSSDAESAEDTGEPVTKRRGRPRKQINYDESCDEEEHVASVSKKIKTEKPRKAYEKQRTNADDDEMVMECKPDITTLLTIAQTEFVNEFIGPDIKEENLSDAYDE